MLSNNILEKLNRQVNLEAGSAHLYLQMSAWLLSQELDSAAAFFRQHADEERQHMMKLFDYINETGALALLGDTTMPAPTWASHIEMLEEAYAHECMITSSINDLVETALAEKDFSTFEFLQWYVAEQHEEEHLFGSMLHKARIMHTMEGRALFRFDEEVRKSVLRQGGGHGGHHDGGHEGGHACSCRHGGHH